MKRYGLPYKGSKNSIAAWVVENLPPSPVFVDLFAGGCAITHRALEVGRYDHIICNDITDAPALFCDAISGKYREERRWIDREEFHRLKVFDPYVRYCWSFGNDGDAYLYSKEKEPYKRAFWMAAVFDDYTDFEGWGLQVPIIPIKPTDWQSIYKRKIELGRWLKANSVEVKKKYIAWYLEKIFNNPSIDLERLDLTAKIEKNTAELQAYLLKGLKESGLTQSEVNRRLGTHMAGHYFGKAQWSFPTREEYQKMQTFMPLPLQYDEIYGLTELLQSLESLESLESLQSLERLQSLESLERLQSLESLERLQSLHNLECLQRLQRLESLQSLHNLECLQRLQSLQRLESLERLQRLQFVCGDYKNLEIPADAIIYADPPYINTSGYNNTEFDHAAFYNFARNHKNQIVISEYTMPDDFVRVREIIKNDLLGKGGARIEGLWIHRESALRQYYGGRQLTIFDFLEGGGFAEKAVNL